MELVIKHNKSYNQFNNNKNKNKNDNNNNKKQKHTTKQFCISKQKIILKKNYKKKPEKYNYNY